MNMKTSHRTRFLLAQSLRDVENKQEVIEEALSLSLKRSALDPELSDEPQLIAERLLSALIDQVRQVVDEGSSGMDQHQATHRLKGISGRYYSRFADALATILVDVLGPIYPRATSGAWSEAFWSLVRAVRMNEDEASYDEGLRRVELVAGIRSG